MKRFRIPSSLEEEKQLLRSLYPPGRTKHQAPPEVRYDQDLLSPIEKVRFHLLNLHFSGRRFPGVSIAIDALYRRTRP